MTNEVEAYAQQALERAESATELEQLIEGYSLCARSEGLSENTIMLTRRAVNYLSSFLLHSGLSIQVEQIGVKEIRSYILYLKGARRFENHPYIKSRDRKLAGHSINCYLRSLSAFWGWLVREGFITDNPFSRIKIPKAPRKVITPFSQEQIQSLFQTIDTSTSTGLRNYTLLLALLDTGARLSEITGLKNNDVDLENRWLKVFGKGSRERRLPIGKRLQAALWKYRLYRPQPATEQIDNLFLTKDGWPLTKNRVEAIIKNLGRKAGLQGVRCSPHTFRHTFCVQFLRNGGNLFSLQQITGHSSLEVLRGYVALAESDILAAHKRYSPADNLDLRIHKSRSPVKIKKIGE